MKRVIEDSYVIQEALPEDFEECAEVISRGFGTVAAEFGLTVDNCPTNGAFLQVDRLIEARESGDLLYKMKREGRIIGFMQLERKNDGGYELEKITVLPEARHLGAGRHLLDFAKMKVRELGGTKITIGIIEENRRLKEWYQKYGFLPSGTKKFESLPFTVGFLELPIE